MPIVFALSINADDPKDLQDKPVGKIHFVNKDPESNLIRSSFHRLFGPGRLKPYTVTDIQFEFTDPSHINDTTRLLFTEALPYEVGIDERIITVLADPRCLNFQDTERHMALRGTVIVTIQNAANTQILTVDFELVCSINMQTTPIPEFSMSLARERLYPEDLNLDTISYIGDVVIQNPSDLKSAEIPFVQVHLVGLHDAAGRRLDGVTVGFHETLEDQATIHEIPGGASKNMPVYLNFKQIPDPARQHQTYYDFSFTVAYPDYPEKPSNQHAIRIFKSEGDALPILDMYGFYSPGNTDHPMPDQPPLMSFSDYIHQKTVLLLPESRPSHFLKEEHKIRLCTFVIGNDATRGEGLVGFPCDLEHITIDGLDEHTLNAPLHTRVQFSSQDHIETEIENIGRRVRYTVSLQRIDDQGTDLFEGMNVLNVTCTFNCLVTVNKKPYRHAVTLVRQFEEELGDVWISADFGTNAMVIARGHQDKLNHDCLLKIRNMHPDVPSEENDYYIPTSIRLNPNRDLDSPDFIKIGLTAAEYAASDEINILPTVKKMIGYSTLQLAHPIQVNNNGHENVIHDIEVDTVLNLVYQTIIKYATGEMAGNKDEAYPLLQDINALKRQRQNGDLNKIVFTVPNMFTEYSKQKIKQFIEGNPAYDYLRRVECVAESDAVLCYYDHKQLLEDAPDRNNEGYILVYDIGAGTLDITYAKISVDKQQRRTLEILYRTGASLAGNNIDYIIMAYFQDIVNDYLSKTDQGILDIETLSRPDKYSFKQVIKDKYKILFDPSNLDQDFIIDENDIPFGYEPGGNLFFSFAELSKRKDMLEYFQITTARIFDMMFQNMGYDLSSEHLPHIDKIIFSGRTMRFPTIQQRVEQRLRKWTPEEPLSILLDREEQKTAVVLGAIVYASRLEAQFYRIIDEKIYPSIGYITIENNKQVFKPLLTYHSLIHAPDETEYRVRETLHIPDGRLRIEQTYATDPLSEDGPIFSTTLLRRSCPMTVPIELIYNKFRGELSIYVDGNESPPQNINFSDIAHDKYYRQGIWPQQIV